MKNYKPNIAVLIGDPSGIGPELISKLLTKDETNLANILVIGEKNILQDANKLTGCSAELKFVENLKDVKFDNKTKFFRHIKRKKQKI